MNVVIIGGGQPGKFGNDLALRMRNDGHNVYIVSHKDYRTGHPHDISANFSTTQGVVDAFNEVTTDVDIIDMIIFNSNNGSYPSDAEYFTSTSVVDLKRWEDNVRLACHIPHILGVEALKRMNENSKIIFMISYMAVLFNRKAYTSYAGYAGNKAMQAHMMRAFAEHNDKGAIATAIAPHFMYDVPENYKQVFELVYNYINNLTIKDNSRIMYVDAFAEPPSITSYVGL
jgi:NAD(P)-dependent dehydrogenase (short-subunit alcohol dehydrogenase family)